MDYAYVAYAMMRSFLMLASRLESFQSIDRVLSASFRYSCKLFANLTKVISFKFVIFHTLCTNHPGWGIPLA